MKLYSLRKSRRALRHVYHLFLKKQKRLPEAAQTALKKALTSLQEAVLAKDAPMASSRAHEVERLASIHFHKTTWGQIKELVFALGFALIVAIAVRQIWFEFYEIPSGSMRPTFKEQDRLAVSKTSFGINIPLTPKEFYFDPALVQRSGIVIFTGEDMDIRDVDTLYFYVLPGKKQYVKRMIGKPGDILYFYGGHIYGIDRHGKDISAEFQTPQLASIEHIPFIDFDRKLVLPPHPVGGIYSPAFLYQMNQPVAKLYATSAYTAKGDMLPLSSIHAPGAPPIQSYSDLWGFGNFAMARLLTKAQVKSFRGQDPSRIGEGLLYLELRHHPSLNEAHLVYDELGRLRPAIGYSFSLLPLNEEHLKALFSHLYTARFTVKEGKAYRWGMNAQAALASPFTPKLTGVPDGCYEFYHGKAYEVLWQGITKELPLSHPLYQITPERAQLFFNLGMEWDTRFDPQIKAQRLLPARYAYFREGDLYTMGGPLLKRDDAVLQDFVTREKTTAEPFVDRGAPLKEDGLLDSASVRHYGIQVPDSQYLVLGDNHAMSADSREFGFVPESNLRGAPDFIFWPPGERFGPPNQPCYPFVNIPRLIVWGLAALCIGGGTFYWRRKNKLPLKI
jgi:signal peptidase I